MPSFDFREVPPLILASASPRRQELLGRFGVSFRVEPSKAEEPLLPYLTPEQQVLRIAGNKADEVAARCGGLIVAADTIVVVDGEILGKPSDSEDAERMLLRLSGRWHEVLTALVLHHTTEQRRLEELERTRVRFRELSVSEIRRYIQSGEPLDKAGAYGAQGMGAVFVERIEGCYHNVVGLPLQRLYRMLQQFNIDLF